MNERLIDISVKFTEVYCDLCYIRDQDTRVSNIVGIFPV